MTELPQQQQKQTAELYPRGQNDQGRDQDEEELQRRRPRPIAGRWRLLSRLSPCSCVGPLARLGLELLGLSLRLSYALFVASARLLLPPADKSLLGETVLITEAGRGMGRELALRLAALGSVVVCWDADPEANRATLGAISSDGGEAHGFAVNLASREDIEQAVQSMKKVGLSDVSILINNGTPLIQRPFLEYEETELRRIFEIGVLSQFWTIQAFLPSMMDNKRGHIVCVCNMCGIHAAAGRVPYNAATCAVRGLMRGLGEELRLESPDAKINLTTVYPFHAKTVDVTRNPGCRFSSIFGAVSVEHASKRVIRAIQKNYDECSVPRCLMYMDTWNRILPNTAARLIMDFLYLKETRHANSA